ncbi:MAG: response regulator [Pseudomonadota bacterium]|nr:response regulator [Pseudomonadota bacterium]
MTAIETRAQTDVVLIVDDAPDNLALLCEALDVARYMVLVADDGISALERMAHLVPDIVLLDAMMPGLDGFETCRRIKAHPEWKDVPVIFMTGLTETRSVVLGFEAGGVDYVTKPIVADEVLARVATHLRNSRALREALRPRDPAAPPAGAPRDARLGELTQREEEVLDWLACGKTNRDIGQILSTSPRTISKHLEHIFLKLGVETRSAAASLWARQKAGRRPP